MSPLAAAALIALFSMPGLGGGDEDQVEVPSTPELWNATLTDSTLTDTNLTEFSWDGYTHVQGTLGAGTISIKFDDITKIDFEETENKNKSLALVVLKNGTIKKIGVDGRVAIYGKTGFGNFKVQVKDVKKIVFTSGPMARPSAVPSPKSKP
jgi:hypothetical protein